MAKWVRHFFKVYPSGDAVSAPAYKGIALLKIGTGVWSVTHMNTGANIIKADGDYHKVRQFAAAIADLTDWNAITTVDQANKDRKLVDRIIGLVELFSDDGEVANA